MNYTKLIARIGGKRWIVRLLLLLLLMLITLPSQPAYAQESMDGVQLTIELYERVSYGDQYERIRSRLSNLSGDILFDTYDDGDPYDHAGLFEGESFTVNLGGLDETIVISVQGNSHRYETVKVSFTAGCFTTAGEIDGSSYIKFKLIDVQQFPILRPDNHSFVKV